MILLFNIGFLEISWVDLIDMFFVTLLLYQVYKLMKGSIASKVFLGFLFLYLTYLMVNAAEMELLSAILGQVAETAQGSTETKRERERERERKREREREIVLSLITETTYVLP